MKNSKSHNYHSIKADCQHLIIIIIYIHHIILFMHKLVVGPVAAGVFLILCAIIALMTAAISILKCKRKTGI